MSNADLLSRLEALTGPSRDVDSDFAVASGQYAEKHETRPGWVAKTLGGAWVEAPAYTKSLDAAVTLVPENLRWQVSGGTTPDSHAVIWGIKIITVFHVSPVIALLIAILRARETEGK